MKDIRLIIKEIEKHEERLAYAKNKIGNWNLSKKVMDDPEKVETMDAFIFRFSKMQDAMGERLFPAILDVLGEEYRNKPFIDILSRLEQLEFISSAETWKKLRETRNAVTHTYPWETNILIEGIKEAMHYSEIVISIFENIKNKIDRFLR